MASARVFRSIRLPPTFRSLENFNYRVWAGGAFVSNVGTWMQRVAQDWLVLAELTHGNATAVGTVMALQFVPQILLLPLAGVAADRLDRRRLVAGTQAALGVLSLALGVLAVSDHVQLWHVYIFSFLLGCASALDMPARQAFVSELVGEDDLSNAVALNSTLFNLARMIGPAVAGILVAAAGSGWVFLINAASYVAVLCSLALLRRHELHPPDKTRRTRGGLADGFRYVRQRPDLKAILLMMFLIGAFGLNFPIFISTMSVSVFHAGPGHYGALTSAMAIGSVAAALVAAHRPTASMTQLLAAAAVFALGCSLAAIMPNYLLFGCALVVIGMAVQIFITVVNSLVQLSAEPAMRGRMVAILFAVAIGGNPVGAPIVGWAADSLGPRWALAVGAAAGLAAAMVAVWYFACYAGLRLRVEHGRLRITIDAATPGQEPGRA